MRFIYASCRLRRFRVFRAIFFDAMACGYTSAIISLCRLSRRRCRDFAPHESPARFYEGRTPGGLDPVPPRADEGGAPRVIVPLAAAEARRFRLIPLIALSRMPSVYWGCEHRGHGFSIIAQSPLMRAVRPRRRRRAAADRPPPREPPRGDCRAGLRVPDFIHAFSVEVLRRR